MRILGPTVLCRLLFTVSLAAVCHAGTAPEPTRTSTPAENGYDIRQGDVTPPRIRKKKKPEYSLEGRSAAAQGSCLLEVIVAPDGQPENIVVVSPIGFGLEKKAIESVSEWQFYPAKKNGVPVPARMTVEVSFRLPSFYFDSKKEAVRTRYNLMLREIIQKGNRLTPDQEVAMRDFVKQGFTSAETVLGLWNLSSTNSGRNETDGVRFIEEAAKQAQPAALYVQGQFLTLGYRMPKNVPDGVEYMKQAAVLGSVPAQNELGARFESGDGVPPDPERARRYFRQCARSGDAECQYALSQSMQAQGNSTEADNLQALAWLQLAAEKDHAKAKRKLAEHPVTLSAEQYKQLEALKGYLPQSDFR